MMRKYLTLLLAATGGLLFTSSFLHAATSAPAITDQDAVRFLNPDQVKQWNDATDKLAKGQKELTDGNKLAHEQPDTANPSFQPDLTADHAKGNDMVREANTLISQARRTQNDLRKIAIANRNNAKEDAQATAAINYSVDTSQWPEAVHALSGKLLAALADQKYKRVYLAGVYSFEDGKYVAKADLTEQLRKELAMADKDGKTFASKSPTTFKLGQQGGKLIISYPDRDANQQANAKAAVVVGEILFDSKSGYAAFSLRAVDLSNMHDVANQASMLSVEPTLGKMLGLTDSRVPSKRITPSAATDRNTEKVTPVITVNLQDPDDFLGKGKQAANAFGVASAGPADSPANRFAILMLKSYFLSQQKDLKISDVDFLVQALPTDKPDDASAKPADVTGVWIVPNVESLTDAMELNAVKARDLAGSTEVTVGNLSIHRDLPKLSYPSIEDLRAGGYGASK